ncbi:MAG TPA: nitroreductase family protein [Bacteroidales bacterium]|jgi:nitroreductase|nr:nitroreductase family protein [Bacteroidales bacterium]
MEYYDLIRTRESIRNYDPEKTVPGDVIERILEAGRLAPSACNNQPWRFLVISSREMLAKVRDCYDREWFKQAPCVLVIAGLKDKAWVRSFDGYNSVETDAAIAMTHILLAAENEGLGACWIENYNPALLRKSLNIPDNQVVYGITPLGYPGEGYKKAGNKKRKALEDIAEYL